MKSHFRSIYLLLLVVVPAFAKGQQGFRLNLNYTPSLPMGDFEQVTDGMSWSGWEMNIFYQASSRLSIGLGGASHSFYKKYPPATFHEPGRDVTAVVTNAIELVPILLKVRYDAGTGGIRPFVGLGAGINVIHYDRYYGEFVDYNHTVMFAAQPELGVYMPVTKSGSIGFNIGAGYNFMPFKNGEVARLDNLTFKAGLNIGLD